MTTKKNEQATSKVDKIICDKCGGKPKPLSQYYASDRDEYVDYGGYIPTCKKCCSTSIIDENLKQVTSEKIKPILKKINIPFIESVFIEVADNPKTTNSNFLGNYKSLLNLKPKYKNLKYSDTVDIEIEQEKIRNSNIIQTKKEEVTRDMIVFWGDGKTDSEYISLQDMFDRFINNEEDDVDYKKESDYKTLCELEHVKRKLLLDGTRVSELTRVIDTISKLSSDLNIKAIQKKEDNSNRGAYDLFIKKIETTKPVFDMERDLGKKDEVKELLELYFYAYLMDVNNQKTQFTSDLYEELNKYTPNIDDYKPEGDE